MAIRSISNSIHFGARINPAQEQQYSKDIRAALTALDKEFNLIIHSNMAPTSPENDTGVGNLYSQDGRAFMQYMGVQGFEKFQVGPDGYMIKEDGCPYNSDTFAKNLLLIPLKDLTTEEYGNILSKETFDNIVQNNPNKERTDYKYVIPAHNKALDEAWDNFKKGGDALDGLRADFNNFKNERGKLLDRNSLYVVLTQIHGKNNFREWGSELDKNLFRVDTNETRERINQLKTDYADEIESFLFKQMLVSKARQNASRDGKTIGDSQVAFSDMDVWAHPDAFLKGWKLGCPPDYFAKEGQAWGFDLLNFGKLFNEDGSLGPAGQLLYDKYYYMALDNRGGYRVDHALGLITPYGYREGGKPSDPDACRVFSSTHPDLAKFTKKTTEEFAEILDKIVIQAALDAGLKKDDLIFEDLGEVTDEAKAVLEYLNLRGIRVTQFANPAEEGHMHKGSSVDPKNIITLGTHDNEPTLLWAQTIVESPKLALENGRYLAKELYPNASKKEQAEIALDIISSPEKLAKAKWQEMLNSPARTMQVFVTDFFGGTEVYNRPGTDKGNWELRVDPNYKDQFYKDVAKDQAPNIPELLREAMERKDPKFTEQNKDLIERLVSYAQTLKEKC